MNRQVINGAKGPSFEEMAFTPRPVRQPSPPRTPMQMAPISLAARPSLLSVLPYAILPRTKPCHANDAGDDRARGA